MLPDDKALAVMPHSVSFSPETQVILLLLYMFSQHNNSLFLPYGLGCQAQRERGITGALFPEQFQERSN